MQFLTNRFDLRKLKEKHRRLRLGSVAAIELGDCHAVAWLTCEAARLQDVIRFAEKQSGEA
jgi:hypothetical protein